MITWGKKVREVGFIRANCPGCQKDGDCQVFMTYEVYGSLFVFNTSGEKKYLYRCMNCGHEGVADAGLVQSELSEALIPPMDRFGCVIFVVGFIVVVLGITCIHGQR